MDITENELLEELAGELSLPPIQPEDVTVARLAARAGVSLATAARHLAQKRDAGELVELEAQTPDGHRCKVYRRKGQ